MGMQNLSIETNPIIFHRDSISTSQVTPRSRSDSMSISPTDRLCLYFASGSCRYGDSCRFRHDTNIMAQTCNAQYEDSVAPINDSALLSSGTITTSCPPAPVIVNLPTGHPVFSIDVECVATGVQHNARSVAHIALVDEWGRPIFSIYVKQDQPVFSYITQLTGLTKEMIDENGLPQAEALAMLRGHLPPNAILVGQNILKDVQWLQLAEGVDYHSLVDISALFRVWNPATRSYVTFSQDHCARVWIGVDQRQQHNAVEDAAISMSLFNVYRIAQWDPPRLYQLQMATLNAPRLPSFSTRFPTVDGCCMGNRKTCTCGAPFFS